MSSIRPDHHLWCLTTQDLRKAIDVAPSTLNEILYEKHNVTFVDDGNPAARTKRIAAEDVRRILEARGYTYPKRAKVIGWCVTKGGVGKTVGSFWTARRLASYGSRVLFVDIDPQSNATAAFDLEQQGITLSEETPVIHDVVSGEIDIKDAIIPVTGSLHLLPSTLVNSQLENTIRQKAKNTSIALSKHFDTLKDSYDYIFLDCAPALNLTNTAAICSCDTVVLPINPDPFSQIGLKQTLDEIGLIQSEFSRPPVECRILFNRFDQREFTSMNYLATIVNDHKDKIFRTVIKSSTDIKNALVRHEDLFAMKKSTARADFDDLALEILGLREGLRLKPRKAS